MTTTAQKQAAEARSQKTFDKSIAASELQRVDQETLLGLKWHSQLYLFHPVLWVLWGNPAISGEKCGFFGQEVRGD